LKEGKICGKAVSERNWSGSWGIIQWGKTEHRRRNTSIDSVTVKSNWENEEGARDLLRKKIEGK